MTAIAGIYELDGGPVERSRLDRVAQPTTGDAVDALGDWVDGSVGLACALARISPESKSEQQPYVDPDTGAVVLLDGRIDNRRELRRGLADLPAEAPDVAYVAAAYAAWGGDAVGRLIGDFALAVCDPRDDCRLLLACDPMGAKPLYHAVEDGRLLFASTLRQVLRGLDRRPDVDDAMIVAYVYRPLFAWPGACFHEGVDTLRGGELLEAHAGGVVVRRYWTWRDRPPDRYEATGDEPDEFRAILVDAVEARVRSSPPVAVYLSGGLDSGSVASVAGRLRDDASEHVRAYTYVFDRFTQIDEREYAQAVCDRYHLPHTLVACDDCWTLADLDPVLDVLAEPLTGPFDALNFRTFAIIRDDGVRALLTGHGGDILLLRNATYFAWWLTAGRWRPLLEQLGRKRRTGRFGFGYQLAAWGVFPLLPSAAQRLLHFRRGGGGLRVLREWMPPAVQTRYEEEGEELAYSGRVGWWRELRNDVLVSASTPQGPFLDRLLRRYGLEQRHPFFDVRIAEFVLRTPPDVFFRDGRSRWIVGEALHEVLPPLVRDRTHKTIAAPLMHYGLRERRADFVRRLLDDSELVRRGYVLEAPWRSSIERYLGGTDGEPVWGSLSTEIWLRHREGRLPPLA